MNNLPEKPLNLDTVGLLKIIIRWKKHLLIILCSALVISFIFTMPFFMPEKFKSIAILYPSNLVVYSTESPTEQMLQQLASETIRDRIIETFDLYNHYSIDTTKGFPITRMFTRYDENIKFNKTEFESVEIEVWDTDPLIAAAICDSLISFVDRNIIFMQRSKTAEVVQINKILYEDKRRAIDSMETALNKIRLNYGILDYKSQSKELSKALYKELSSGRGPSQRILTEMNNLQEKGGEYNSFSENLDGARKALNLLTTDYEKSVSDLNKELTYCNVVTHPLPAERKSYPKRSILMLIFSFSVTTLSFLIILGMEKYNRDIKPALKEESVS